MKNKYRIFAFFSDEDYSEISDGVSRVDENMGTLLRIQTFTEREVRQCRTCTRHARSQSSSPPIKREKLDILKSFSDDGKLSSFINIGSYDSFKLYHSC